MNYYPEQLRRIAAMCEAMNKADGLETEGDGAVLAQRLAVVHPDNPDEVLGHLIDDIGGAWSFLPIGAKS